VQLSRLAAHQLLRVKGQPRSQLDRLADEWEKRVHGDIDRVELAEDADPTPRHLDDETSNSDPESDVRMLPQLEASVVPGVVRGRVHIVIPEENPTLDTSVEETRQIGMS